MTRRCVPHDATYPKTALCTQRQSDVPHDATYPKTRRYVPKDKATYPTTQRTQRHGATYPVARTVLLARKRWMFPSSRLSAMTPTQRPCSMSRSSAKYSTKYSVS